MNDFRVIPGEGFGPLKFGASIKELLELLGKPSHTYHPADDSGKPISLAHLSSAWPKDWRATAEWLYDDVGSKIYIEPAAMRGPCVVGIETWHPDATLLGVRLMEADAKDLAKTLAAAGITSLGEIDEGNAGWIWAFSRSLSIHVFTTAKRNEVRRVEWYVERDKSNRILWPH